VLLCSRCTLEENGKIKTFVVGGERQTTLEPGDVVILLTHAVPAVNYTVVVYVFKYDVARSCSRPVRISIHFSLIFKDTYGIVEQLAANRSAGGYLPRVKARRFVPEQNLVLCISPIQPDGVAEITSFAIIVDHEINASITQSSQVFIRGLKPGGERNGPGTTDQHF